MKKGKIILIVGIILAVVVIFYFLFFANSKKSNVNVATTQVKIGSIAQVVTATGTIEPIQQVEVGTQVSGEVKKVYVDYNSHVTAGQLIAELDKTNLKASLEEAQTNYDKAQNELNYIKKNYDRQKSLYDEKLISQSDFDEIQYKYNNAQCSLKQAKASLDKAKTNLSYADIYSPVDGVVLSKSIEEGQTVAASFNTPTLFTIAQDLTKMQVEADIDEADIGAIKEGQRVSFTVDAFQNDTFEGKVTQVRLDPTVTSNVVTYTVIIEANNPNLKLMPGLTATVTIYTLEINDVMVIPESAVNYDINPEIIQQYYKQQKKDYEEPKTVNLENNAQKDKNYVWVLTNNKLEQREVQVGQSDEINIQIIAGLATDETVVTSMQIEETDETQESASSPFMQGPPGKKK